jgi:hypothetical protein
VTHARLSCRVHGVHVKSSQPLGTFVKVGDVRFVSERCISVAIAFQDASWLLGIA